MTPVPPPPTTGGVTLPLTVMAAVPLNGRPALGLVSSVRPVIVRAVTVLLRLSRDRGEIVTIASSTPSLFSSTGSLVTVALGNGTPLTTIVVGSMLVTGSNGGET